MKNLVFVSVVLCTLILGSVAWTSTAATDVHKQKAVAQFDNPLGVAGVFFRVGYLDDGGACPIELDIKVHDFAGLGGVQIARGFIRKQERRRVNDRARDADELLLAAGELVWKQVFLGDDLKAIKNVGHHATAILRREVLVRQGKIDIFSDGEIVEQVVTLEHHANALACEVSSLLAIE